MRYIVTLDALHEAAEELRADGHDFVEIGLCEADRQGRAYIELTAWSAGERDRQICRLYINK